MMRSIFFILITIITPELFAQGVVFNKTYNYLGTEVGGRVLSYKDSFFVIGDVYGTPYKPFLLKTDNSGSEPNFQEIEISSWTTSHGYGKQAIIKNSSQLLLCGFYNDTITTNPYIAIIDFSGTVVLKSLFEGNAAFHSVIKKDNKIATCGYRSISGKSSFEMCFFNDTLEKDTCIIYGSPSKDEVAYSISQTPDGGYVMSGYRNHGNGDSNPYLVKTDSNGNFLWDKEFELSELSEGAAFNLVSSDGYIYLVGEKAYSKDNYTKSVTWLCKLANDGSIIWEREFGVSPAIISMVAISERQDGSILVAGNTTRITPRNPLGKMVGIVYNIDTAGNEIYEQYFVINPDPNHDSLGYETHYVRSLDITPDGGYVVAGFITQLPGQDLWVVKFDSNGCYDPTYGGCIVGVSELSDMSFQLSVWPNPARDVLNMETDSPMERIAVYNQLGGIVSSYELVVGSKLEQLDISSFKPGLYFLMVKTEKGVETKKVIIN